MKLIMSSYDVKRIELTDRSSLEGGTLSVDAAGLRRLILADPNIEGVDFEVAYPGESARIVHVLDAVEPRIKVGGEARCFPGFLGMPLSVGSGRTNRLADMAVISTADTVQLPSGQGTGCQEFNEGIIDMSGIGATRSCCSDTINLCLCLHCKDGLTTQQFDESVRMALLKAADSLASVTLGLTADSEETFETGVKDPSLPNVAYINQIQSQGHIVRTFLYAMPVEGFYTPTIVEPTELMDGAVVSGNYRNHLRCCTWLEQNNPYVKELFRRHGKELNFVGMVLSRGHYDDLATKVRSGQFAAKLAEHLGAKAAVLSLEGTGNSNVDYMATIKALEHLGIAAVPTVHEFGGPKGNEEALFDCAQEAVSIVSGGGIDRWITVPAMERVIGGRTVRFTNSSKYGVDIDPHQSFEALAHFFFCGFRSLQDHGYRCEAF